MFHRLSLHEVQSVIAPHKHLSVLKTSKDHIIIQPIVDGAAASMDQARQCSRDVRNLFFSLGFGSRVQTEFVNNGPGLEVEDSHPERSVWLVRLSF